MKYTLHATRYTLQLLEKLKFSLFLIMFLATNYLFAQVRLVLLEIYNVLGKLVTSYQTTNNSESWVLDTSKLASGLYIVALRENGTIIMQKKLIVN